MSRGWRTPWWSPSLLVVVESVKSVAGFDRETPSADCALDELLPTSRDSDAVKRK
jgi:hypothetical protein